MSSKVGSILGYLIAVAGLLFLFYTNTIFSRDPAAGAIQILAFVLMIWARITFKQRSFHLTAEPTDGGIVKDGPYKFLRHPIYAAIIYFGWACLLGHPRVEVFVAAAFITIGLHIRIVLEEKELLKVYPEYAEYSKQARRLIPFVY
ncbi:MAG: isoprenylcysteine carboxylmethyltransferase family protein [Bacteroidales bacterium]|nr:isoprenylcysteine carboxylmethyltransferase family protein [Bacteroidales bacterium]